MWVQSGRPECGLALSCRIVAGPAEPEPRRPTAPHAPLDDRVSGRAVAPPSRGGNEGAAMGRPPLVDLPRVDYGDGSVNSDVCGFRYGNRLAPASHLPDRFQINSPRVMSDS
jgi:hypothetical protein